MARVAPDIMKMTKDRVRLRPIRSPRGPNTIAPTGRIPKDTANTPNTASSPVVPSSSGKNTSATVLARWAYAAQSN